MHNVQKSYILFLIYLILSLNSVIFPFSKEKQICVVFRYDDYSSTSSTEFETKLIESFRKFNISVTFGVVPFAVEENCHDIRSQNLIPLTESKIAILKKAVSDGVIEIAQHGYSHQTITEKKYTEFKGLGYTEQYKKIEKSKIYLEGKLGEKISTFIPPWNSYDLNTLAALENLKFNSILAALNGIAKESSLKFLPATCSFFNLKDAFKSAMESSDPKPIIVVLFHQIDFKDYNRQKKGLDYKEFEDLLAQTKSEKNIKILSLSKAIESFGDLSNKRLENSANYKKPFSLLPKFFHPSTQGFYLSSNAARKIEMYGWGIVFFFNIILILFSFILYLFIYTLISSKRFKYMFAALLAALFVYTLFNYPLNFRTIICMDIIVGISLGVYKLYHKLINLSIYKFYHMLIRV